MRRGVSTLISAILVLVMVVAGFLGGMLFAEVEFSKLRGAVEIDGVSAAFCSIDNIISYVCCDTGNLMLVRSGSVGHGANTITWIDYNSSENGYAGCADVYIGGGRLEVRRRGNISIEIRRVVKPSGVVLERIPILEIPRSELVYSLATAAPITDPGARYYLRGVEGAVVVSQELAEVIDEGEDEFAIVVHGDLGNEGGVVYIERWISGDGVDVVLARKGVASCFVDKRDCLLYTSPSPRDRG